MMSPRDPRFFLLAACLTASAFIAPSYAVPVRFRVDADSVSYQKETGIIEASGSVDAGYGGTKISAGHIVFDNKTMHVTADGGFTLEKGLLKMKGQDLDYFVKTGTGTAENVMITSGPTWIRGRSVKMDPETINLTGADFSSCDLATPHYKISSDNMTYYQDSGWIVETFGMFYLSGVPLLPLPTYVFDTGLIGGFYKKKNPAPLPDIGSNAVDGTYVKQKIVWRLSSYSYGLLGVNYATKKGLGGGLETNYILNNDNEGNIRLYNEGADGWSGGATHTFYFGDKVPTQKLRYLLYQVLNIPPRKKYDLSLDLSYRERINYERVSMLPMLTLRYIDVPFTFLDFNPRVMISAGKVTEESSGAGLFRLDLSTSLDYLQSFTDEASLRYGLDISYSSYSQMGRWTKLLGRLDYSRKLTEYLEFGAGYSHYFINEGASPFNYENYRYFPYDDARSHLAYRVGDASLGVSVSYNLPLLTVRDIDYNASVGLHCFDATFTWRAARQEFTLGLTLATR